MHRDGARGALHGFALARSLIKRLAVDLYRRIHGRQLHLVAQKLRQNGFQLRFAHGDRGSFQRRAGHIAGIRAQAQPNGSLVGFIVVQLAVGCCGGPADKHSQHTRSHGVQRAGMPQLAGAQHTAQLGQHIKACPLAGLIYDQNAIFHRGHSDSSPPCSSSFFKARSTSRRMAAFTFSCMPSISHPAARPWPPPPRQATISLAAMPRTVRTLIL